MKKIIVLVLALLVTPVIANAEVAAPKIVVVDIQKIMKESKASKALSGQLESKRKEYQGQIDAVEKKLKASEEDLVKQKAVLTKEAMAAKLKDFNAQVNTARSDVQNKKNNLEKAYRAALGTIQQNVQTIIEGMATEQGFNMAIPTSQLIYAQSNFDISVEVLKRLDAKLPSVSLKF